nr:MAG TPA_asm: ATPase [Caudoviricetes sp.]
MLEKLMKLYVMAMATGVTSPVPHMFGPPGSGKSTVSKQLADLLGVRLHVTNVSRISPLNLEGDDVLSESRDKLHLILARMWANLKDGDILLLDEFLRGFPEVYNGLLDILTSREVAGHKLPKVFIIAASNSLTTYDKALEDRLLHLPVADPRHSKREANRLAKLFVEELGLHPSMATSMDVAEMLKEEVFPTFDVMDQLGKNKKSAVGTNNVRGCSLRHLIGQAKLREAKSTSLITAIAANNQVSLNKQSPQHIFLLEGKGKLVEQYQPFIARLEVAASEGKLTPKQALNFQLNRQLIELELAKQPEEPERNDDGNEFFVF